MTTTQQVVISKASHDLLVRNAMDQMGWSYDLASDCLLRALEKWDGELLLIHLRNMGFIKI